MKMLIATTALIATIATASVISVAEKEYPYDTHQTSTAELNRVINDVNYSLGRWDEAIHQLNIETSHLVAKMEGNK